MCLIMYRYGIHNSEIKDMLMKIKTIWIVLSFVFIPNMILRNFPTWNVGIVQGVEMK